MPTWCTSYVDIQGSEEALRDLKASSINDEGQFDFHLVRPVPDVLKNTVSPLSIVATQEEADEINRKWNESDKKLPPGIRAEEGGKVRAMTKAQARKVREEHGATDWYEWACSRWGTKWNARDTEVMLDKPRRWGVRFTTAWGLPDGILQELESRGFEVRAIGVREDGEIIEWGEDPYDVWVITIKAEPFEWRLGDDD